MDEDDEKPDIDPLSLDADDLLAKLTGREQQIMRRLAVGDTNREIADELKISIKTVDTHRGHVLKKLGVRSNVTLVHLALARGWVSLQQPMNDRGAHVLSNAEYTA